MSAADRLHARLDEDVDPAVIERAQLRAAASACDHFPEDDDALHELVAQETFGAEQPDTYGANANGDGPHDDDGAQDVGASAEDRAPHVSPVAAMLGARADLMTPDSGEPLPWTPGATFITRPGLRGMWFGPRGSGKSLAALLLAVQVAESGGSVVYLDLENGSRRQKRRLAAILADRPESTREAVTERLDYRPTPRLQRLISEQAIEEWAALFTGVDLLVIDSAARVLGQLGLDEDRTADFSRFVVSYIDPAAQQGTSTVLLDNTGWSEADRSRGTSSKWDLVEVVYKVSGTEFAADKAGTITLERKRSRDGDEAHELVAHVGEGTYTPLHKPPASERVAAVREALLSYIAEHPGATTEEVAKAVGMRKAACRSQLRTVEGTGTGNGTVVERPSQYRDRRGTARTRKGWYLASQSQLTTVPDHGTDRDQHTTGVNGGPGSPRLTDGDRTQTHKPQPIHSDGPESAKA